MGILIKKRQQGGSIYGDPRYLVLNADIQYQQPNNTRSGTGDTSVKSTNNVKPTDKDAELEGLLPSDIQYYNSKEASINAAMAEGFKKDTDFDHTPAYEMLINDKYELERTTAPQLKGMSKLYHESANKFKTKAAGDAPAIVGDEAIVQIISGDEKTNGRFITVRTDELLVNAPMYRLLTNQEVLSKRFDNPEFSGFTKIGQMSNQIIDAAYGSSAYDKDIDSRLNNIGYAKSKGKYVKAANQEILDLDMFGFDPISQLITDVTDKTKTKTNLGNITNIYNELKAEDTNLTKYLEDKSIAYLHSNIANGKIKLDDAENSIPILKQKSINTQLVTKLKSKLMADETESDKKNGTDGKSSSSKEIKSNIILDSYMDILSNTEHVEIPNINKTDNPSVGSIMNDTPASFIYNGDVLLATGYGENNKTEGDETVSSSNRRTVANNKILTNISGGETLMTTFAGVPFENIGGEKGIAEDGDLNKVILAPKSNLTIVLAPTVTDNVGNIKVDFTNDFTPKMLLAIQKTYEELNTKGITQEDVAAMGPDALKELEKTANKYLNEIVGKDRLKNPPTIRATFAFNVQYEAHGDSNTDPNYGWDVDADNLHSIIEEGTGVFWEHYARETVAFLPISNSFWKAVQKKGSLPEAFENTISSDLYEGAIKATPIIGNINISNITKIVAEKEYEKKNTPIKKNGGKLYTTEELTNLLFK